MRPIPIAVLAAVGAMGCQLVFPYEGTAPDSANGEGGLDRCRLPYVGDGDFDRDGVANAEDGCPISAFNDDTDLDMVGDVCDPDELSNTPLIPDCIYVFDEFSDRATPCWLADRWQPCVAGKGLCSDALGVTRLTFQLPIQGAAHLTIQGKVESARDAASVFAYMDYDPDTNQGEGCGIDVDPGINLVARVNVIDSDGTVATATQLQSNYERATYQIDSDVQMATMHCEVSQDGAPPRFVQGTGQVHPADRLTITTLNTVFRLQSVMLIGTQCPPR